MPPKTRAHRVLMIAPTSFFADYGCHVRILEEATVLQKQGHQVTIATYHNGDSVAGLDIRRTLPIPWRRHYLVGSSRHKVAFDALLGLKTFELLLRRRYDVIHAHLHEGALIGIVLGRIFHVPVVFDFQGSLTGEMSDHHFLKPQGQAYRLFRRLETWIDRHAPAVFTSSAHAAKVLADDFGCCAEHVHVLPDCVNADAFRPASAYEEGELAGLRTDLRIPSERKLIVYLGLLAEYQGTGLLLEALQRVLQIRQDVHLLLMGFPNEDEYEAQARALGVSEHVTFTGRVPYQQAPRYLALGDVSVAPKLSLTEGAGKLLNYMAIGRPVVAFDTPVAREYLGSDGTLVPVGDVQALAQALVDTLYPAPAVAQDLVTSGHRLRKRAVRLFSWDTAGAQIADVYHSLIDRRIAPRFHVPKRPVVDP